MKYTYFFDGSVATINEIKILSNNQSNKYNFEIGSIVFISDRSVIKRYEDIGKTYNMDDKWVIDNLEEVKQKCITNVFERD